MSNQVNDNIRERALEALNLYPNKYDEANLIKALERDDLDEIRQLTIKIEMQSAKDEFIDEVGDIE